MWKACLHAITNNLVWEGSQSLSRFGLKCTIISYASRLLCSGLTFVLKCKGWHFNEFKNAGNLFYLTNYLSFKMAHLTGTERKILIMIGYEILDPRYEKLNGQLGFPIWPHVTLFCRVVLKMLYGKRSHRIVMTCKSEKVGKLIEAYSSEYNS